jgi:hypothetical protein
MNVARDVMVGVLVSRKSLQGVAGENASNPKRYPKSETLGDIFLSHKKALNLIHFNTHEPNWLLDDLYRAHVWAGPHCHGFQLNMPWPSVRALLSYKALARFERKTLVLQCGMNALLQVDRSPIKLMESVKAYEGAIDYLLLDQSGGRGEPMDGNFILRCLDQLSKLDWLGLTIAGGLGVDSLYKLEPILREFPGIISIDAESKLRDRDDNLDMRAVHRYLYQANETFFRYESLPA